eukprot:s216_g24.t1
MGTTRPGLSRSNSTGSLKRSSVSSSLQRRGSGAGLDVSQLEGRRASFAVSNQAQSNSQLPLKVFPVPPLSQVEVDLIFVQATRPEDSQERRKSLVKVATARTAAPPAPEAGRGDMFEEETISGPRSLPRTPQVSSYLDLASIPGYDPASLLGWRLTFRPLDRQNQMVSQQVPGLQGGPSGTKTDPFGPPIDGSNRTRRFTEEAMKRMGMLLMCPDLSCPAMKYKDPLPVAVYGLSLFRLYLYQREREGVSDEQEREKSAQARDWVKCGDLKSMGL